MQHWSESAGPLHVVVAAVRQGHVALASCAWTARNDQTPDVSVCSRGKGAAPFSASFSLAKRVARRAFSRSDS